METVPKFESVGGRRADRIGYQASVQFRASHRRAEVRISDILRLGARISGVFPVRQDDRFFIKHANLEPIEARVVWITDGQFGCEFVRPLNEAILDAITGARI